MPENDGSLTDKDLMAKSDAEKYISNSPNPICDCLLCSAMCMNPCWPTPQEAKNLILLGYGNKLEVANFYLNDGKSIKVVAPKQNGAWCIFLTKFLRCRLHSKKLKPTEGKIAIHDGHPDSQPGKIARAAIASLWREKEGIEVVNSFERPKW